METKITLTIEQLEQLVERAKNKNEFADKKDYVCVSFKKHPNGNGYIEFEQPSNYTECSSTYYRYDA